MLPLIQLKKIVEKLIDYPIEEHNDQNLSESETFLYKLLYGQKDGIYDFYEQAKAIFLRTNKDPRKMRIQLEYPKDKTTLPAIILREPTRDEGDSNTIGKAYEEVLSFGNTSFRDNFRDSKQFDFSIICFSNSTLESILISEVLYSLLVGAYDTLASIYNKVGYSMREIMVNTEMAPTPIIMREVRIKLQVDNYIPSLIKQEFLSELNFNEAILYQ